MSKIKYTSDIDLSTIYGDIDTPDLVVCIPAFDEPDISKTIKSLAECEIHDIEVLVLVCINDGYRHTGEQMARNEAIYTKLYQSTSDQNFILTNGAKVQCFYLQELPDKKCGVGLVRKIMMDSAIRTIEKRNGQKSKGILVCLDADCLVSQDYLMEIFNGFTLNPKMESASIHFEHVLTDNPEINEAIIDYEMHLRIFINMQRILQLPFAFQTVGSSMAVRSEAYKKEGGMNQRQAGEDFYFLQKFIKKGKNFEIQKPCVYPSSRKSNRVPFGTGKAITDALNQQSIDTYNPESYKCLKVFLENLKSYFEGHSIENFNLNKALLLFFKQQNIDQKFSEIKRNTKDYKSFLQRFYRWFDAFLFMKYLHFMRDQGFENVCIDQATKHLFKNLGVKTMDSKLGNLNRLRSLDRAQHYIPCL